MYPLKISLGTLFLKFDGSGLSSSLGGSSGGELADMILSLPLLVALKEERVM